MDYFNRLNLMAQSTLTPKRFASDITPPNPVTYEKWESDDGTQIGFKATSSYNSSLSCATRLITYFVVKNYNDPALVVRDFDSNGVPVIWIPKGADIITTTEPYDTSGVTNTSYKLTSEPANERAGVSVETYKLNTTGLNQTALNIMRQENPELFDIDDLELEDFADWWVQVNKTHADTVNRIFSKDYALYYNLLETDRIKGGRSSKLQTNINDIGAYSVHAIYGYDWDAEIESQKKDWSLAQGDDFLGMSWSGLGYTTLMTVYYTVFFWTMFRKTLTFAYLPKVGMSIKGVGKLALATIETIAIDFYLLELPHHIRAVDATKNYNLCGFPDGGHYQKLNVKVYDASKTDWQGTPHCKNGENRKVKNENPFTYDPEIPCCPEGAKYNKALGVCEQDGQAITPSAGGSTPSTGFGVLSTDEEGKGAKIAAGLLLGVVAITVLTGTK